MRHHFKGEVKHKFNCYISPRTNSARPHINAKSFDNANLLMRPLNYLVYMEKDEEPSCFICVLAVKFAIKFFYPFQDMQ